MIAIGTPSYLFTNRHRHDSFDCAPGCSTPESIYEALRLEDGSRRQDKPRGNEPVFLASITVSWTLST
jgi:hypothetical protein